MADVRKLILGMEVAVNETADLAAALCLCAQVNREEGLGEADRAGIHRLAAIVHERAQGVLAAWHQLDAATGSMGGVR